MSAAQDFLLTLPPPSSDHKKFWKGHKLNKREAKQLALELGKDANDLYYSACVSYLDALRGVSTGLYSWATTKLYYSLFYSLRALSCCGRHCIFYVGKSPHGIEAQAGMSASAREGTTHKVVLTEFATRFATHFLVSQSIDLQPALNWMTEKREQANYRLTRFIEPSIPDHFRFFVKAGARRSLDSYLREKTGLYVFDPDHAIIALPLRALEFVRDELNGISRMSTDERNFLRSHCRDRNGQIKGLVTVLGV